MKLPIWTRPVEKFVDFSIPWILVLLAFLIVIDFTSLALEYHFWIIIGDYVVIIFFILDLIFKWFHVQKITKFVRLYWIDILAVFPFYVFFRFYGVLKEAVSVGEEAQRIVHEAQLARELRLLREADAVGKEARFFRSGIRFLRILRARWYVAHNGLHKISRSNASK